MNREESTKDSFTTDLQPIKMTTSELPHKSDAMSPEAYGLMRFQNKAMIAKRDYDLLCSSGNLGSSLCRTSSQNQITVESTDKRKEYDYRKRNGIYNVLISDYDKIRSIIDVNIIKYISASDKSNNGYRNEVQKKKYDDIMRINLTFSYLWQIGCMSVFVCIINNKIREFIPFLSKNEDTTVKAFLLDSMSTDIGDVLVKGKTYAQGNTVLYTKLKKTIDNPQPDLLQQIGINDIEQVKLDLGDPQQPAHHAILDRCILYGYEKRNHELFDNVNYFHYAVYFDMLTEALTTAVTSINTMFFINLFDHPVIKNNILLTNKLLSNDVQPSFSDITFPYADAWMKQYDANAIAEKYNITYGISNHYTELKKYLEQNIDKVHNPITKKNKIVFRGTLTGCAPHDPTMNSRHKLIKGIRDLHQIPEYKADVEKYFDVGLSALYKGAVLNNPIYDDINGSVIVTIYDDEAERERAMNPFAVKIPKSLAAGRLDMKDLMSGYQYMLDIDGYVSAWRLPYELYCGNIVFIYTKYTSWLSNILSHDTNCIIIEELIKKEIASPSLSPSEQYGSFDELDADGAAIAYLILKKIKDLETKPEQKSRIIKEAISIGQQALSQNYICKQMMDAVLKTM